MNEPLDVDSSLQSGGHRKESPWAAEPPLVEETAAMPTPSAGKGLPSRLKRRPTWLRPRRRQTTGQGKAAGKSTQKPTYGEEIDPEFGSFLEGLE